MDLEKIKAERFLFSKSLYEEVDGKMNSSTNKWSLGGKLGFDREKIGKIYTYLKNEYLLLKFCSF